MTKFRKGQDVVTMSYKIVHATQTILFACGFYSIERAEAWVSAFNPQHYVDKTLRKEDLRIVKE